MPLRCPRPSAAESINTAMRTPSAQEDGRAVSQTSALLSTQGTVGNEGTKVLTMAVHAHHICMIILLARDASLNE